MFLYINIQGSRFILFVYYNHNQLCSTQWKYFRCDCTFCINQYVINFFILDGNTLFITNLNSTGYLGGTFIRLPVPKFSRFWNILVFFLKIFGFTSKKLREWKMVTKQWKEIFYSFKSVVLGPRSEKKFIFDQQKKYFRNFF